MHLCGLGDADVVENDPEDYAETLKLDADRDAFFKRFADHFTGAYPLLREMLAASRAAYGTTHEWSFRHTWELMKWVLWWAETNDHGSAS